MSSYNRSNKSGCIESLGCYGVILFAIIILSTPRVGFGLIFIGYMCTEVRKWWVSRGIAREACIHKTIGAKLAPNKCTFCVQDAELRLQILEADRLERERFRINELERFAKERAVLALKESSERERIKLEKKRQRIVFLKGIQRSEYLRALNPREFEKLICELFRRMGYEVELTRYTGDNGVDGYLIKNGKKFVLQCKRVKGSVGEPVLRDLYGTMHAESATECYVVTTGKVSRQAHLWAKGKPINIIELNELRQLIERYFKINYMQPNDELF